MGKRNFSAVVITGILSVLLWGCGGKGGAATDSDTMRHVDVGIDSVAAPGMAYITSRGIGGIHPGLRLDSVKPAVAGLYDTYSQGADVRDIEALTYDFSLDGNVRFCALDFGNGVIDVVYVSDYSVGVDMGQESPITLGCEFSRILSLPGVRAEWVPYDAMGVWAWQWQGLWFMLDPDGVSERLSHHLYTEDAPPSMRDLDQSARVGYIGTGLPF